MTDAAGSACWLAAVTPAGRLELRDVADLLADGKGALLARLEHQVGGHVDRVRVHTRVGVFEAYTHEYGPALAGLPRNQCAELVLESMGMGLGYCAGSVLFVGVLPAAGGDQVVGLSEQQIELLRQLVDRHPATV